MEAFKQLNGLVAPVDRVNVDTDAIIPKQFLKRIERTGFGQFLFFEWRFDEAGEVNPSFEMNKPRYAGAEVLISRANFGCGSSREHAPWAIMDYGFRSVIAPSFADIFYNNCFKNGILPIRVTPEELQLLTADAEKGANAKLSVDLAAQEIRRPDGESIRFDIDPFRKHCLLNGLDDIGLTLEREGDIAGFEQRLGVERPWA